MKKVFKVFFTIILTVAANFDIMAQPAGFKPVDATEKKALLDAMNTKMQSVQCTFRQEKKSGLINEVSVSEGVMYFRMPSSLRWEYLKPQPMAILMNNGKLLVTDANGNQKKNNARMFRELTSLIASMVSGKELQSEKNFKAQYYSNASSYWIKLTPANRRLKAFFNHLEMTVDKKKMVAVKIVMNEKEGDLTTVTFSNHKVNVAIDDKLFVIK